MIRLIIFALVLLFSLPMQSQTVGTIQYNEGAFTGYTFFSPFSGRKAYMVDNCGRLINSWDRGTLPGLAAYFLDNGLLFRTYKVNPQGPFNSASNAGGLEFVDWDNNVVWSYELNTPTQLSHHDAFMMPNGNILWLTWEIITEEELIALGRDPDEIAPEGFAWNEKIIEIEPIGTNEINIVWEWKIRDHYIQNFDETKANFGVVSEHPELFDLNLPDINSNNSHADFDYNHFNAIHYNEALDQILISVRNSDEIWILDHSTTIEEAAGHTGGNSGKGGDILYRYGNANAYGRGEVADQKLFGQHGVNWIADGADAGKILIYNNGNGRPGLDHSTVEVITPPIDGNGNYIVPETEAFGPAEPDWVYGNLGDEFFYSAFLSNAQRLPNGNTLINAGSIGHFYEVDDEKNVLWEYDIPLSGDNPVAQGNNANNNGTFRAYKYGIDFPGFDGIDITIGDLLEINPNPEPCEIFTGTRELEEASFSVNYAHDLQLVKVENPEAEHLTLKLYSSMGKLISAQNFSTLYLEYPVTKQATGLYILSVTNDKQQIISKKIIHY